jgi:hypothetical protein
MLDTIPNLWSDDIKVNVVTPLAVLRKQAHLLTQMTKGVLEADVATVDTVYGDSGTIRHGFDVIAPALDYRQRLFTATHGVQVYPVVLEADCFRSQSHPDLNAVKLGPGYDLEPERAGTRQAKTEDEFLNLVREILRSDKVRSVIQSLIARSNDLRPVPSPPSPSDDEDSPA